MVVIFSLIFLSQLSFSLGLPDDSGNIIDFIYEIPINYSEVNVNNSYYWQGYTPITYKTFLEGFYCLLTGCTMQGDINMGDNNITNIDDVFINDMKGNNNYGSVNDWWNLYSSPGRLTGGLLTNPSGTNIVVQAGEGTLRMVDDDISQLKFIGWDESSPISVPTNSILYFGVEYNGGSPQVISATSEEDFDLDTSFPLGHAINQDDEIYILNNPWWVGDGLTNMIEKSEGVAGHLARDRGVGGLILGYTGTRNPTMTAGQLWGRTNEFAISDFDASATDTFDYYYRTADGNYTENSDESQWSVELYDDGSGTLANIPNNQYAVIWVWVNVASDSIALIYPQNTYPNSATAEAEEVPNTFPGIWYKGGIIIGRIIIQEGEDVPVEIQSAFTQTFTAAQAADHGNLGGLEDDDHTQYARTDGARNITGPQIYEDTVTMWDDYNGIYYHTLKNTNNDPGFVVGSMYRLETSYGVWGGLGLTGNTSTISGGQFADALHLYSQGYGDNLYTVDGNKSHRWYTDPSDSHDFSALDNEVMNLDSSGNLNITNNLYSNGMYWKNGLKYGCCNETNGECFELLNTSLIDWETCSEL